MTTIDSTTRIHAHVSQWLFLSSLACGLTASAVICDAATAAEGRPVRPNIVFLFSDDQRWNTLGCMGDPVIRTPHLDRMAKEGVLFRNAFVTTSICGVSRTSILTGSYARARGVADLRRMVTPTDPSAQVQDGYEAMKPAVPNLRYTYPALLRERGYETGYIGKWDVGPREAGFQMGSELFDFWAGDRYHGNYWHEADCPFVTNDGRGSKAEIRCTCPPQGSIPRVGHDGMSRPVHTERDVLPMKVRQFLSGRDPGKPFLLCVSFRSPKDPWSDYPESAARLYESDAMPVPRTATREEAARQPDFLRKSMASDHGRRMAQDHAALSAEMRKYYRQITTMDGAVGEIRRLLHAAEVGENTVIIFTSDNGHYLGDHGFWGKWTPYEPSIRVPLIVFDPRAQPEARGMKREEMVLNIDLAPTMLALAGCPIPAVMQGRDFTPLLRGERPEWRTDWFYEHTWTADGRIAPSEAVRSAQWKYIRFYGETPVVEQLFDLRADPDEVNDRITDPTCAAVLHAMRAKLEAYWRDLSRESSRTVRSAEGKE
jgi:arylsulfatase A-like enzyme